MARSPDPERKGQDPARGDGSPGAGSDIHAHPHRHEDAGLAHAHPHPHAAAVEAAGIPRVEAPPVLHDHAHALTYERFTYLCSPVHALDPRAKIMGALAIILAVVLSGPPSAPELVFLVGFLLGVTVLAGVPVGYVLSRSALVLPFAGTIALFAPLARTGGSLSVGGVMEAYSGVGWIAAYAILAKAWLAALTVGVLSVTTPVPRLFKGLERLGVPDVLLMLLSFMYRFGDVFRRQLTSLRRALDSRGFALGRWGRTRLLGSLAGNLFLRASDRGERVHAAMLARGYTGTLPTREQLSFGARDGLALAIVGLAAAALVLY